VRGAPSLNGGVEGDLGPMTAYSDAPAGLVTDRYTRQAIEQDSFGRLESTAPGGAESGVGAYAHEFTVDDDLTTSRGPNALSFLPPTSGGTKTGRKGSSAKGERLEEGQRRALLLPF
jgi:hypothetical protein